MNTGNVLNWRSVERTNTTAIPFSAVVSLSQAVTTSIAPIPSNSADPHNQALDTTAGLSEQAAAPFQAQALAEVCQLGSPGPAITPIIQNVAAAQKEPPKMQPLKQVLAMRCAGCAGRSQSM